MRALGTSSTLEEQARERREKLDKQHSVASNVKRIARVVWWTGFIGVFTLGPIALWQTGRADAWLTIAQNEAIRLSADFGMTVRNIEVSGREKTDPNALLAAIGKKPGTPIITFDVDSARERIEQLSWVRTAAVERQLPDTLIVSIVERRPLALWQTDQGNHVLIDGDGAQLQNYELGDYLDLPVLVGDDAPEHCREMLSIIKSVPHLYESGHRCAAHRPTALEHSRLPTACMFRWPKRAWTRHGTAWGC